MTMLVARKDAADVEFSYKVGVVLHVLNIRPETSHKEGSRKRLGTLRDDVVVEVLMARVRHSAERCVQ